MTLILTGSVRNPADALKAVEIARRFAVSKKPPSLSSTAAVSKFAARTRPVSSHFRMRLIVSPMRLLSIQSAWLTHPPMASGNCTTAASKSRHSTSERDKSRTTAVWPHLAPLDPAKRRRRLVYQPPNRKIKVLPMSRHMCYPCPDTIHPSPPIAVEFPKKTGQ